MVDISRIENGRITLNKIPCCLPDLVAKTVEGFSRIAAEKNRKINIESCENVKKIEADSEWLAQAISHLISNAIKFSPNEQDVIVRIESHNGDVKVVVKDNGIGIPENDLDKIFNKFHKVEDPAHKALRGSGLGLSIVKSIVDLHNGRIEVTSTPNTGTQFTLIFPAI